MSNRTHDPAEVGAFAYKLYELYGWDAETDDEPPDVMWARMDPEIEVFWRGDAMNLITALDSHRAPTIRAAVKKLRWMDRQVVDVSGAIANEINRAEGDVTSFAETLMEREVVAKKDLADVERELLALCGAGEEAAGE